MVKLRLARMGRKNRPFFRIVAVDSREKRDGRYLENLGWYDPFQKEPEHKVKLRLESYKRWIGLGAQPTEKLAALLRHTRALPSEAPAPAKPPAAAKSKRRPPGKKKK